MNHNINFLRDAAPYIQSHRHKTFIISLSGDILQKANLQQIITDIAILSSLGVKIILIHGMRPQIEQRLKQADIQSTFIQNIRVTTQEILTIVKEVVGHLRVEIENLLSYSLNIPPIVNASVGVISGNFITAKPIGIYNGIDFHHTGKVRKFNLHQIQQQLDNHNIVLLSPLGFSPTKEAYNLAYEEVAVDLAKAMKIDKLIFLEQGIAHLPKNLTIDEINHKKIEFNISASAISALQAGVKRIHLVDGKIDGGILLELYTRDGIGTMLSYHQYEEIRKATIQDISGIIELIRPLEQKGILIKRSREQLELDISYFIVISKDEKIVGCSAVYEFPQQKNDIKIVEFSCLVIHPDYRGQAYGDKLLNFAINVAKKKKAQRMISLTTQTTDWFKERGFIEQTLAILPENKKAVYNYQRNSKILARDLPLS